MSTPAKRRPASPSRRGTPSTSSGDRSGTGTATPSSSTPRTRAVRSSTLVSARAAARRESLLLSAAGGPGGSGANGARSPTPPANAAATTEAEEAARAETLALLDDLKTRLRAAEERAEVLQRQHDVVQSRLDESVREQAKLEERTHEYEEQLETLVNDKRETARKMQQMEAIYEGERSAMTREKEDMANREEEMQRVIQRLKDSLAQRALSGSGHGAGDDEGRPSRYSMHSHSPSMDGGGFAPPSSLQRSDSRNTSKLLLQKDKLIESLRLELAEAQIKLVETENQGGGRVHEVERQLMEARMANARLMEDNESYQLLLQEKTLKGDFGAGDFGFGGGGLGLLGAGHHHGAGGSSVGPPSRPRSRQNNGHYGSSSHNTDALAALEGRIVGASSLADELGGLHDVDVDDNESEDAGPSSVAGGYSGYSASRGFGTSDSGTSGVLTSVTSAPTETQAEEVHAPYENVRRLEADLKAEQDRNKALTLYINKIIERLLEHQDYQYILDKSTDGKQPPPPPGHSPIPTGIPASITDKEKERPLPPLPPAQAAQTTNTPPPPPPPQQVQPAQPQPQQPGAIQSFLQRTKSMASRSSAASDAGSTTKRARPVSYMPEAVMSNPDTAPSIPIQLGRSASIRRPMRPMSEQFTSVPGPNVNGHGHGHGHGSATGAAAASVINAMYKGGEGPLSPGLRNSQFFGSGSYTTRERPDGSGLGTGTGAGTGSGVGIGGNFPGMRSETSSVSGDSASVASGERPERPDLSISTSTSSSPPRPAYEKTAFTGTKVRPLRLVQENADGATTPTSATNKRASWMGGWWGGKKDDSVTTPTQGAQPGVPGHIGSPEAIRE